MSEDTIKKCNFCRLADELNSEEIPFWSKKNENYSPYPKMISCDSNYSLKNEDLKDILPDLDENSLKAHLTLGKDNSNKYVFYWAANPQKDIHTILGPKEAYGDYENHGLLKTDDKGEVILKFNPPQPYKENKKTNPKHIHYILESSEKTWLPLKTIRIIQNISLEILDEQMKLKDTIILNALPEKYYKKDKIPNSYNLPSETLEKLTGESKTRKVKNFIKSILKNYPNIENLINGNKLILEDVPIITYCAHSKCDASDKLIDHLYECKFNNTQEYKEGIEEYNKKRSFFTDTGIDKEEEVDDSSIDKEEVDDEEDDDDEIDYEEISEEEDDDYIDIIHEGIEYSYLDGILYDESLNPIGEATITKDKITEMDEPCKKYHQKMKGKDDPDDDIEEDDADVEEDIDEDETSETKEKMTISQDIEKLPFDPSKCAARIYKDGFSIQCTRLIFGSGILCKTHQKMVDSGRELPFGKFNEERPDRDQNGKIIKWKQYNDISSDDSSDEDKYDEESINKLKGGKGTLKTIVKNISKREKNSYNYGDIKNMKKDDLINIALTCQGKRVCSKKSDYKYKTKDEIENMTEKQLRELLNEMINRDPETFRYSESSWTRDKLIHFILTCQGSSKPRNLGNVSFVGGGWCL